MRCLSVFPLSRLPTGSPRPAAAALLVQVPGLLGLLALLAWAAADLLAAAWAALRTRPEVLQQLAGSRPALANSLQQALDAESSLDHATLALLRHALPALPALLLGLLLGEGSQLVRRTAGRGGLATSCGRSCGQGRACERVAAKRGSSFGVCCPC